MKSRAAFTLVELSIVLVILGLLVGGVLTGQSLIEAAKMRSQLQQIQTYTTAYNTFKDKYMCKPGDCTNITSYFGTGWISGAVSSYGNASGNGNGDGIIGDATTATPYPFSARGESLLVAYHLSLAGLTECCAPTGITAFPQPGQWSGTVYPPLKLGIGGVVPLTINSKTGWWMGVGTSGPASACNGGTVQDFMNLSSCAPSGSYRFTPIQAQGMDTKIDDGKPTTGRVYDLFMYGGDNRVHVTTYGDGTGCITNPSSDQNTYNLTVTTVKCNTFVEID